MPTFAVRETRDTTVPKVTVDPPHPPGASMVFELVVVDALDASATASVTIRVRAQ